MEVESAALNTYFGEIHTHTALSFDVPGDRGPMWALEAARKNPLDFAAVTDHVRHVMPEAKRDGKTCLRGRIGELLQRSKAEQPFGHFRGSVYLSRAIPEPHFRACLEWADDCTGPRYESRPRDYYYVRVRQSNDQMAWSSPIWVENQ